MWNDSLQPGVISPAAKAAAMNAGLMIDESICGPYFNALTPLDQQKPIVCVDWCDAAAYCTWANKHLCGKIGGGSIDTTPPKDAASLDSDVSEWYRACSNAGANKWPYGNTYTPARCNDEQHGVTNVDKYDQCEGGYPGVFDMSGNVSEWTDECTQYQDPPEGQNCMRRGGAYYNTGDDIACTVADATLLSLPSDNVGFRCCQ
jgi:formylglycine-generating enzyme required for sulfatase activity